MDDVEEFCRSHWPGLLRSLSTYVGDADLGEDLAQEALATVVARWHRVSRMRSPGGYAYRVGVNLAKDELTRRARHVVGPEESRGHGDEDPITRLVLADAVRTLPDRQRLAVSLRYLADLSVTQTAEVMRCRPGTVKSLCSHAPKALEVSPDLAWHPASPVGMHPARVQDLHANPTEEEARTDG